MVALFPAIRWSMSMLLAVRPLPPVSRFTASGAASALPISGVTCSGVDSRRSGFHPAGSLAWCDGMLSSETVVPQMHLQRR